MNSTVPFYACEHGTPGGCNFCRVTVIPIATESPTRADLVAQANELRKALERVIEYHVPKINPLADAAILSARAVLGKVPA